MVHHFARLAQRKRAGGFYPQGRQFESAIGFHSFQWRIRLARLGRLFFRQATSVRIRDALPVCLWPRSSVESERSFPKADAASSSLAGAFHSSFDTGLLLTGTRVLRYERRGRGFNSLQALQFSKWVISSVGSQSASLRRKRSSVRVRYRPPIFFQPVSSAWSERLSYKQNVVSSNPTPATKF